MTLAFDPTRLGDVIEIMYSMISGPAGPRDWSVQDRIFHPDARQMRTGVDEHGKPWIKIMGLDDYAADTTPFFATNDFFEVEIGRRVEEFGNMAQAWSVYEARKSPGDTTKALDEIAAQTPEARKEAIAKAVNFVQQHTYRHRFGSILEFYGQLVAAKREASKKSEDE